MATDALYNEVAEIIRCVLAKEKSVRNAVYGSSYKVSLAVLRKINSWKAIFYYLLCFFFCCWIFFRFISFSTSQNPLFKLFSNSHR